MAAIDGAMSKQLAAILHQPALQKLEGSWRGLHHLVMNSETSAKLKIKVLNISKRELFKDVDKAVEFDQSQIFKKLYENEFGTPGGEPYGALIGDYEFTNHPEDVELLGKMSNVAAAAFCPFVAAASPKLFGFDSWTELSKPRDLEKIFDTVEYAKWRSFRESEDSRFVTLVMPRVLARLPYGSTTKPIEEFDFEEVELDAAGRAKPVAHDHYTWMNAALRLRHEADRRLRQVRLVHGHPRGGGRRQGRGAAGPHLHQRRRRPGSEVPDRDRHHRPPRGGTEQARLPAAVPLQEHRLRGVLRRPDDAEAQEVRPAGGDGQRGHLRPAAVHHGDVRGSLITSK